MSRDPERRAEERFVEATVQAARQSLERDEPFPSIGVALAHRFWGRARPNAQRLHAAAVLAITLFVGGGSLGAAGALPAPLQAAVSRTAAIVGLDIPSEPDDTVADVPAARESESTSSSTRPADGSTTVSGPGTSAGDASTTTSLAPTTSAPSTSTTSSTTTTTTTTTVPPPPPPPPPPPEEQSDPGDDGGDDDEDPGP